MEVPSRWKSSSLRPLTPEQEARRKVARIQQVKDLRYLVDRGQRAETFLRMDFWKMDVEPAISARLERLKNASTISWRPGQTKTDQETMHEIAYNTAVKDELARMVARIFSWIAQGQEAEKKLDKLESQGVK